MAMTALFKWRPKAQEPPAKCPTATQPAHNRDDDDDEDDTGNGTGKEFIRRNSRFYRSMRKKKLASVEQNNASPNSGSESSNASRGRSHLSPPARQNGPRSPLRQNAPQSPLTRSSPASPRIHHSNTALPGNGESRSPLSASDKATALRRGGGGDRGRGGGGDRGRGGERTGESASSGQCGGSPGDTGLFYRTHTAHSRDMDSLSQRTAAACSIGGAGGATQSPRRSSTEGASVEGVKLRIPSNGESSSQMKIESICHTLNIVKNIAFLYQEYRDTSKQQEIEQRRQQDGLTSPGVPGGATSPPALQLQLRKHSRSLSLWQNLEAVQNSGLLETLPQKEIIIQEAMFELVTSEASYYKSLEILETHFMRNPGLVSTLTQSDMHFLFSNIEEVMKASERFLMDLENRIELSIQISDVCDIVCLHAKEHFHVFIAYVINQVYQETNYRRILQENQAFRENMARLENHTRVRGLSFTSFLILPFQRITRLKLLVQSILKKAEEGSEREANAIKAHQLLEQIVKECNEGVRKMSRTEELISIGKTLEFKSKSVPVISHSRWLLKKGEVQEITGPKTTRTMQRRKLFQTLYLFLFNNLLLITKRSSSGDKFQVLNSCSRAMLRTEDLEDQGQLLASVFMLKLLENQEDREINYMLKANSMSEKLRWICALTPNRRTRFTSKSTHQTDSPQVQCIQSYSSQEPDELSIEMADVLNILERTVDGWMMGERLHDGERGWFPSRVVEEIQNQEVRAQNLRECQRIHQAQGGSTSGPRGASKGGRRTPKASNVFGTRTGQPEDEQ